MKSLILGNQYSPIYGDLPRDMADEAFFLDDRRSGDGSAQLYNIYHLSSHYDDGTIDDDAGILMWLPRTSRVGIWTGKDSLWTDATGPDDAIARWNHGDLVS